MEGIHLMTVYLKIYNLWDTLARHLHSQPKHTYRLSNIPYVYFFSAAVHLSANGHPNSSPYLLIPRLWYSEMLTPPKSLRHQVEPDITQPLAIAQPTGIPGSTEKSAELIKPANSPLQLVDC